MADYFTQFAFLIETRREERRTWLKDVCTSLEAAYEEDDTSKVPEELAPHLSEYLGAESLEIGDLYPPDWAMVREGLLIQDGESAGADFTVFLCQMYLRVFEPKGCFGVAMAHTCSKPRPDGFGGAGVFITKDSAEWMSVEQWLDEKAEEHIDKMEV